MQFIKSQDHHATNLATDLVTFTNEILNGKLIFFVQCRENTPYATKEKFLSNGSNKTELISKLVEELRNARSLTVRCRDDAGTDVEKQCLEHSLKRTVEVRAEDADILIMLIHHYHPDKHHLITVTTSNGNYCVKEISLSLANKQRKYLLFCHSFTGYDTVPFLYGISKEALFKRFCSKDVSALIDIFYDDKATKEHSKCW